MFSTKAACFPQCSLQVPPGSLDSEGANAAFVFLCVFKNKNSFSVFGPQKWLVSF